MRSDKVSDKRSTARGAKDREMVVGTLQDALRRVGELEARVRVLERRQTPDEHNELRPVVQGGGFDWVRGDRAGE